MNAAAALAFIDSCPLPGFIIDKDANVMAWNRSIAALTRIKEPEIKGSRNYWMPFYSRPRPLLCDVLLKGRGWEYFAFPVPPKNRGSHMWTLAQIDKPISGDVILFVQAGLIRGDNEDVAGAWQIFQTLSIKHVLGCSNVLDMLLSTISYPLAFVINGQHFCANKAFAKLWGLKNPVDTFGRDAGAFIDASDIERFRSLNDNLHANLKSGQIYKWKYNINGKVKYVEGSPNVFTLGEDKILISSLRDVTEIVRQKEKLAREKSQLEEEKQRLMETIGMRSQIFVGKSQSMKRILARAASLAHTDANIVVLGETGVGKSLLARMIHDMGARANKPFLSVNCAAIPGHLFESEFFGHVKGAFTGALPQKPGYLLLARGGTLFLDEVGELSPANQSKLLHAIETKKFIPLGSTREEVSDVRLICATNRDLKAMLKDGSMREDFFYRIFVADVEIPPLRERMEDFPEMFDFLTDKFGMGQTTWASLPEKTRKQLLAYQWPGNVRELQNVLTRLIVTGELRLMSPKDVDVRHSFMQEPEDMNLERNIERMERELIEYALSANNGRRDKAAMALGINVRTLYRHCVRLGIR